MHLAVSLSLNTCHSLAQEFNLHFSPKNYQKGDVHHSAVYLMAREHCKPHPCLMHHFLGCPSVWMCSPAQAWPWDSAFLLESFSFWNQVLIGEFHIFSLSSHLPCTGRGARKQNVEDCHPIPFGMQRALPLCWSLSRYVQAAFASPTASPLSYKKILLLSAFKALKTLDNSIYFLKKWSMERWFLHLLWGWGSQLRDFLIYCKKIQLKRQFWGKQSRDQPPLILLHSKTSQNKMLRIWRHSTQTGSKVLREDQNHCFRCGWRTPCWLIHRERQF